MHFSSQKQKKTKESIYPFHVFWLLSVGIKMISLVLWWQQLFHLFGPPKIVDSKATQKRIEYNKIQTS